MAHLQADATPVEADSHKLRKELGLRDLVFAQILCVVGSAWVGVAARLGSSHLVFWLAAMCLYYLPLAAVVIFLNGKMPLEGGLYQWAKFGFGEFGGFMTAWNLWVYAVICVASILYVVPTDLAYLIGKGAEWLPSSRRFSALIILGLVAGICMVAIRGLGVGKWLHNAGSLMICTAYAILLAAPLWALWLGHPSSYQALPWELPRASWFALAVFGQMTIGGLSGFEYVAIMAGECRSPRRTVAQSVLISAPLICLMFILGTSSVLAFTSSDAINLIGPIPQTFRRAFGNEGWGSALARLGILLVMGRAIASASLIFTGLTRLPLAAGWDSLLPSWFTSLHKRWRTPVHSILFVAGLIAIMLLLSMMGVREQETMQLLQNASIVHYGITYLALFALPLFGAIAVRGKVPVWLKIVSAAGLISSAVAVMIAIYPIIQVSSRGSYAAKIGGAVVVSNALGLLVYSRGRRRSRS